MYAISGAWEAKTDLSEPTKREILIEWHLGSIKLVVDYDLLVKEAIKRGLIESDEDYSPKYGKVIPGYDGQGE
jgi:hypothetical protein